MEAKALSDQVADLLDSHSDDVYGLWEVDWWFNGQCPTWNKERRIEFFTDVVERQLVDVFFGPMRDELNPLPMELAVVALGTWDNWSPRCPLDQPVYHVMTNEAGVAALRAHMADGDGQAV